MDLSVLEKPSTSSQRALFAVQAQPSTSADGKTTIAIRAVGYGKLNLYGRVFVPGAFDESLTQLQELVETKPVPIGWMHDIPIGKFTTLRDEQDGPYLAGPISKTSQGADAAVLVQDGLTACSVGFGIDEMHDVYFAEPGETVSFETKYGTHTYQFDDYVLYVKRAQLVECSLVLVGADDESRVVAVQSLMANAEKALPAIAKQGASWEDAAYSMALLMGGRGAAAFEELPDLEHRQLFQKIASLYTQHGKTPPAYSRHPKYQDVAFQHEERQVFADRYLQKSLRTVIAGAGGLTGPLSGETREEAERAIQALTDLTRRETDPDHEQQAADPVAALLGDLRDINAICEGETP